MTFTIKNRGVHFCLKSNSCATYNINFHKNSLLKCHFFGNLFLYIRLSTNILKWIFIFFKNWAKNYPPKIFIIIVKKVIIFKKKLNSKYIQSSTKKWISKKMTLKFFFEVKYLWECSFLKIYIMGST